MDKNVFYSHLKKYLPQEEIDKLRYTLENTHSVYSALSVDEDKISMDKIKELYPSLKNHPVCKNTLIYNKNELDLGKSLLFEIGAFYLYEPCSPIVSSLLDLNEDDLVLDMCAAPGGKTIQASFLMHNKGLLISNEISKSRAEILSSNVEKYGRKNTIVISSDCNAFKDKYENTFSKIILDAPCSGSGMFRKESKMMDDWTLEKMLALTPLQKELILIAYSLLKPGGTMVYSTCSFSYEEDEEVIKYLLENTDAILDDISHIEGEYRSDLDKTVHLFPHLFDGEGHFIAKIKKPGTLIKPVFAQEKKNKLPFILKEEGNIIFNKNNDIYLTTHPFNLYNLHIIRAGIKVGNYDKKLGIVYDHALCRTSNAELDKVEVTIDEAKKYILGNSINKMYKKGYVNLTYLNIPFALSKSVNGILKNHYPKGLRKNII